jgi:hypothetical protein
VPSVPMPRESQAGIEDRAQAIREAIDAKVGPAAGIERQRAPVEAASVLRGGGTGGLRSRVRGNRPVVGKSPAPPEPAPLRFWVPSHK